MNNPFLAPPPSHRGHPFRPLQPAAVEALANVTSGRLADALEGAVGPPVFTALPSPTGPTGPGNPTHNEPMDVDPPAASAPRISQTDLQNLRDGNFGSISCPILLYALTQYIRYHFQRSSGTLSRKPRAAIEHDRQKQPTVSDEELNNNMCHAARQILDKIDTAAQKSVSNPSKDVCSSVEHMHLWFHMGTRWSSGSFNNLVIKLNGRDLVTEKSPNSGEFYQFVFWKQKTNSLKITTFNDVKNVTFGNQGKYWDSMDIKGILPSSPQPPMKTTL
ncbi:hypothetical protein CDD80_7315 [Ophiocordyceps camponoti-rufipedis]|uniref:Uncharacterized protein n=1 Tax=Ophiocordyceps camponoti-rufipedis TaxID=2004952 RepID=A0A2C5YRQ7_9HYPO|nr:hypothetical protein CDD80_7315 [Ophiocordyceps camponoti-rufipedis]